MVAFKWEDSYVGFLNMDHRIDRLNHMNAQLERAGITATRHRGKKPQEYDLSSPKYAAMVNRTLGAIPCHEGQVAIMKEAQAQGKSAVVFEDDILFSNDFKERIKYIENWSLTHTFDIVWLGASFHSASSSIYPWWHPNESQTSGGASRMKPDCSAHLGRDCEPTDDPRMIRTFGAYVTFAYIVHKDSIQKVTDYLDRILPISIGIDFAMIAAAKYQPDLKFFSFVPGCTMQIDNMSDQKGVQEMTVWSGQLNNGPYVFQKRMEDFDPTTYKWS